MTTDPRADPARYPRTYHLPSSLILSPVMGAGLGVVSVVLTEPISMEELLLFMLSSLTFALLLTSLLVSIRYVLYPDRIEYRHLFWKVELKKNAIRGYHIAKRRNGVCLTLKPNDPSQKNIRIATAFFKPDATWDVWIAGLRNLEETG